MHDQMYDVEADNQPQEQIAELRLHKQVRRIQEIDKQIADLKEQRESAAEEINRATEQLQGVIGRAQNVLNGKAKLYPAARNGNW